MLPLVDTLVNSVSSGAPSTDIVGMLLISRSFSDVRLALDNFDMEHRLWYELEGLSCSGLDFVFCRVHPSRATLRQYQRAL